MVLLYLSDFPTGAIVLFSFHHQVQLHTISPADGVPVNGCAPSPEELSAAIAAFDHGMASGCCCVISASEDPWLVHGSVPFT